MPTREDRYIPNIEDNEVIKQPKAFRSVIEEFVEYQDVTVEYNFGLYEDISLIQLEFDCYFKRHDE